MIGLFRQLLAAVLSFTIAFSACAIASDPSGMDEAVSYTYDPLDNRTQKVSTLPGFPGGLSNYNANDQLTSDTYDGNGNTMASLGLCYAYDFENHLIQQGGITVAYDGDGNRASKTVAGVKTTYLVDTQNPTGYAQVITETTGNTTLQYVLGLERVSERIGRVARTINLETNRVPQHAGFACGVFDSALFSLVSYPQKPFTRPNDRLTSNFDHSLQTT